MLSAISLMLEGKMSLVNLPKSIWDLLRCTMLMRSSFSLQVKEPV